MVGVEWIQVAQVAGMYEQCSESSGLIKLVNFFTTIRLSRALFSCDSFCYLIDVRYYESVTITKFTFPFITNE
jgi:hypothetical protein